MSRVLSTPVVVTLAAVLVCVALLAGGLADSALPPGYAGVSTGETVGRAGFAYLTGLRVFVAQVLWNRIEPIFHEYYGEVPLEDQAYMLTTFNLVTLLDPQFSQPYYVGPWILARSGHEAEAIDLAAAGVREIPDSGLLHAGYAQILMLFSEDMDAAVKQADIVMGDTVVWTDAIERHDAYGAVRAVYIKAGLDKKAADALERIELLDSQLGDQLGDESHDHDGDGAPDH